MPGPNASAAPQIRPIPSLLPLRGFYLILKREMAEPKSPLPLVCEQMEPVSADWQMEGPLTGK